MIFALVISSLISFCPSFGTPVKAMEYRTGLDITNINEALEWDASNSIWQGYDSAHPFDQPDNTRIRWFIKAWLEDGSERWLLLMYSKDTPSVYYVYAFQNTEAFADQNGNHYGQHPCRVFKLDADIVDSWLCESNEKLCLDKTKTRNYSSIKRIEQ